jgi:hypothetical protein
MRLTLCSTLGGEGDGILSAVTQRSGRQRAALARIRAERRQALERRRIVDSFRTDVIELATRMEFSIDLALSLYYVRTADTAYLLYTDVLWRFRLEDRIEQRGRAVDEVGQLGSSPFAIPIARKVVEARNLMAHSITEPTTEGVQVVGRRRGQQTERLIGGDYLNWLVQEGERCNHELDLIAARIGDWRTWASLHGFDDRSAAPD